MRRFFKKRAPAFLLAMVMAATMVPPIERRRKSAFDFFCLKGPGLLGWSGGSTDLVGLWDLM